MPTNPFDGIDVPEVVPDDKMVAVPKTTKSTARKTPKKKESTKSSDISKADLDALFSNNPYLLNDEPIERQTARQPTQPQSTVTTQRAASKDDEIKEKAGMIASIKNYYANKRFGEFLKEKGKLIGDAQFSRMSVEQLKIEIETLDMLIATRGTGDLVDSALKGALLMAEKGISSRTAMNINGTTNELYRNDRYLDLVERVKLKYGTPSIKMDPLLELTFVITQTALTVQQQNSMIDGCKKVVSDQSIDLDAECGPVKEETIVAKATQTKAQGGESPFSSSLPKTKTELLCNNEEKNTSHVI